MAISSPSNRVINPQVICDYTSSSNKSLNIFQKDADFLRFQLPQWLSPKDQNSISLTSRANYTSLLFGERAEKREGLLFVHYFHEALKACQISLPIFFLRFPLVLSCIKATTEEVFRKTQEANQIIYYRRLQLKDVGEEFIIRQNMQPRGSKQPDKFFLTNQKSKKPILFLQNQTIDGRIKQTVEVFLKNENFKTFIIENGDSHNYLGHHFKDKITMLSDRIVFAKERRDRGQNFRNWQKISDGTESASLVIFPSGNQAKEWKLTPDGTESASLMIFSNGGQAKETKRTSNGTKSASLMIFPSGNQAKEWKRTPDGTQSASLVIFPSGNQAKEWKLTPDGTESASLMIFSNGNQAKEWNRTPDGTQSASLVTCPNGAQYKKMKRTPNGIESASLMIAHNGSQAKKWKRTPDGTQSASLMIARNGSQAKKWKRTPDGVESASLMIACNGSQVKEWKQTPDGAESARLETHPNEGDPGEATGNKNYFQKNLRPLKKQKTKI